MGKPIPIMAGIYMSTDPGVRIRYPLNLVPVPGQDGVAESHLRPAEGVLPFGTGQGVDRAGIVWTGTGNNVHYRVSGTKLVTVSSAGVVTVVPSASGEVGGSGHARLDFGFDTLGILSNGFLYQWDNITLAKVTDPDIPASLIDMVFIDGYFAVTNGEVIAVSDLGAPSSFNALKFDTTDRPDPVKCLLNVLGQLHVVSRNYIDVFKNVGGSGFPFSRVSTAVITKGAVGTGAACVFNDVVAFVGSGRNETPSVYLGRNGQTVRISTTEIDTLISEYTTAELAAVKVEAVIDRGKQLLLVHLPDRTAVYDAMASAKMEQPVWHIRTSGLDEFGQYRARNFTLANDVWVVGDPQSSAIGTMDATISQHYGLSTRWEINTLLLRNSGGGAVMHSIELLGLTGSAVLGTDPLISTSYSSDGGVTFSKDRFIHSGQSGQRMKKLQWFKQGMWRTNRIQRFRGDSGSRLSILSIDPVISPLGF